MNKNLNFNKNELIDVTLLRFYDTFRCTQDTADFVPQKYHEKIMKYIFKNMKKAFKMIDGADRIFQRGLRKAEAEKKNKRDGDDDEDY